jgi:hypothetical protein
LHPAFLQSAFLKFVYVDEQVDLVHSLKPQCSTLLDEHVMIWVFPLLFDGHLGYFPFSTITKILQWAFMYLSLCKHGKGFLEVENA